MSLIKFYKVAALPGSPEADAFYFVDGGADFCEAYLTDNAGVPHAIGNTARTNTLISQALGTLDSIQIVADIAARNALDVNDRNQIVLVLDATGDATVASGAATYVFRNSDDTWFKVSEFESLDISLAWSSITGGPSSTPAQIDAAVADSHTHANKAVLDLITAPGGVLNYNGAPVAGTVGLAYTADADSVTVTADDASSVDILAATNVDAGVMSAADKSKLDTIAAGAEVNVDTDLSVTRDGTSVTVASSTGTDAVVPAASATEAGVMTAADKSKLDGIAAGAQVNVDTDLSVTRDAVSVTVASSTGTDAVLPEATVTEAGVLSAADKVKIDSIVTGATATKEVFVRFATTQAFANPATQLIEGATIDGLAFALSAGMIIFVYDSANSRPFAETGLWVVQAGGLDAIRLTDFDDTLDFDMLHVYAQGTYGGAGVWAGEQPGVHFFTRRSSSILFRTWRADQLSFNAEPDTSVVVVRSSANSTVTLPTATETEAGVMSAADKEKLNNFGTDVDNDLTWNGNKVGAWNTLAW